MDTLNLSFDKRYTYADYLTWLDDKRRELIDGFIILMTPAPARKHQEISSKIHTVIGFYLLNRNSCKVYSAPFDVRLPKSHADKSNDKIHTVVQPDICIVCDPLKLDERGCIGAPDLIVEILSPSTSKKDLNDKYKVYEQAGVKEYWIVSPNDETINVFVLDKNEKYQLSGMYAGDMKIKVSIFDDLEINLEDIFKK
ncbi:MAG: Uma2 family endonuclease [Bacteroidetes bacterium]|nr:MAG: Uma2 family endonuclease [Bacteroidota bacterium]